MDAQFGMSVNEVSDEVHSPCIGVCTVDDDGVCMGCERTLDEIARWSQMSPDDKRRVLGRIAEQHLNANTQG